MKRLSIFCGLIIGILILTGTVHALPVSSGDVWQNATYVYSTGYIISSNGSSRDAIFDGLEAEYGKENGNFIFSNGSAGTVHSIEWATTDVVTVGSFNLMAYHDFDGRDITYRGFDKFLLSYCNGTLWTSFYEWTYTYPSDGEAFYGGGPSHTSTDHNMDKSYLELFVTLSTPVSAQKFKAEFVECGNMGSRIVELDGYAVPEPATLMLLVPCFVGLGIMRKKMHL